MDWGFTVQIIILVVLLVLYVFFSLSKTSIMTLSKVRINKMVEENIKNSGSLERITRDKSKFIGAVIFCNSVCIIGASAITTYLAGKLIENKYIGIIVSVLAVTTMILIFGEITPSAVAKQRSEQIAKVVVKPISIIVFILTPVIKLFTIISSVFIKAVGCDPKAGKPFITEEELKSMVGVSEEAGVLEDVEKEIIFNVFDFADLQVKDVMIPRVDIIAVSSDIIYPEIIEVIKNEQFSRMPVYKDSIDNVVGILNTKDLIIRHRDNVKFDVNNYAREPFYTFEFKLIKEVFKEMKKTKNHMAIVLDEYGGTVGIITIEDLIEEIVGDIEDEYDDEEEEIEVVKEDEYIVNGSAKLHDVSELIGVTLEDDELDSVGGFVTAQLGRIPNEKEEIMYGDIRFVVEKLDKNRIKKVRIFT